ncbi:MAG TPA: ATPase, T2SS/T4P/T4SS family [Candidatus Onthovivens sp.]|nr:ATPase, T2SS/T4P/T4SS family [Candidatus Onthovivens sp.]
MNNQLIEFIETSFLKPLIDVSDITDISFNGEDLFYQDNYKGRTKARMKIDQKEAFDFIRQIGNLSDSQFNLSNPILDISCGKYRINATHPIISRKSREQAINFSIRISSDKLRIDADSRFVTKKCLKLINLFIKNRLSVVIGGETSSGKTEFQKYLLTIFNENTRVIVIDNVDELDVSFLDGKIDLQTWLIRDGTNINFEALIKNALRSNPDWLVISESRGKEMISILNGAMTGHPTITTLHAKQADYMYQRMARMCMISNDNLKFKEVLFDIYDHFKILIYVKKRVNEDGSISRFINEIGTNFKHKYYSLYQYPSTYFELPSDFEKELNLSSENFLNFNNEWLLEPIGVF